MWICTEVLDRLLNSYLEVISNFVLSFDNADSSQWKVTICGSMWQCVAVCGSIWQYMAVCGSVWQYMAVCGSAWQYVAVRYAPYLHECLFHRSKPGKMHSIWPVSKAKFLCTGVQFLSKERRFPCSAH